jgi:hypothetical protein
MVALGFSVILVDRNFTRTSPFYFLSHFPSTKIRKQALDLASHGECPANAELKPPIHESRPLVSQIQRSLYVLNGLR